MVILDGAAGRRHRTATARAAEASPVNRDRMNTGVLVGFTALTNLADGVTKVALPLLAARITHSPLAVSLVALTLTLPWLVTALHVGVLVDRANRKALLIVANVLRVTAVTALIGLLTWSEITLPALYLCGAALGVAEVVALTASAALVPAVVSRDGQERANAWMTGAETVCNEFCGPFLGGMLVVIGYTLALSSATLAFAVTLLLPLLLSGSFRKAPSSAAAAPVRTQIAVGLRHLWTTPLLRMMALTLTVLCMCWGAWMGLIPLLATDVLHASPSRYGILLSALGLGGFAGVVLTSPLNRLIGRRWAMFADLGGTFCMVAAPVLSRNFWVIAASAFLGGMGGTLWTVNARTLAQRLVPNEIMGRFWAAWRLFSWGALPVGAILAGTLGELFGLRQAFIPFAFAVLLLVPPFLKIITPAAVRAAEIADADGSASPTDRNSTHTDPVLAGGNPAPG
jgi:MFS family permease